MARGWCPVCDRLVGISSSGQRIGVGGTACYWLLDLHAVDGKLCEGSGRRI